MKIREYTQKDYEMILSWWNHYREPAPLKSMIPSTTYILEINCIPALSLSLLTTNAKGICFLENFIGNPKLEKERKEFSPKLLSYVLDKAKELDFERAVCFSYKDETKRHYERLGMKHTLGNLNSFAKELK